MANKDRPSGAPSSEEIANYQNLLKRLAKENPPPDKIEETKEIAPDDIIVVTNTSGEKKKVKLKNVSDFNIKEAAKKKGSNPLVKAGAGLFDKMFPGLSKIIDQFSSGEKKARDENRQTASATTNAFNSIAEQVGNSNKLLSNSLEEQTKTTDLLEKLLKKVSGDSIVPIPKGFPSLLMGIWSKAPSKLKWGLAAAGLALTALGLSRFFASDNSDKSEEETEQDQAEEDDRESSRLGRGDDDNIPPPPEPPPPEPPPPEPVTPNQNEPPPLPYATSVTSATEPPPLPYATSVSPATDVTGATPPVSSPNSSQSSGPSGVMPQSPVSQHGGLNSGSRFNNAGVGGGGAETVSYKTPNISGSGFTPSLNPSNKTSNDNDKIVIKADEITFSASKFILNKRNNETQIPGFGGEGNGGGGGGGGGGNGDNPNVDRVDSNVMQMVDSLKQTLGKDLVISSGFRGEQTPGVSGNPHATGKAVDISIRQSKLNDDDVRALTKAALSAGFTGIGVEGDHVHLDTSHNGKTLWGRDYHFDSAPDWAKQLTNWSNARVGGASMASTNIPEKTNNNGANILIASQQNSAAQNAPPRITVEPQPTTTSQPVNNPGISIVQPSVDKNEPGNLEPPDWATRYPLYFSFAA